ncbi:hypothetical protein TWF694_002600 [Orbilia ellipsospora]|uniref:Uncharacterized protein n=1 Tax=Orbilia ellipsospora TaxID=2528407 RepID=A0AAV9X3V2_9PEZI
MRNLTLLGLSLATVYVRAAVDYPHYLYRIGYQDPIIEAYDENDDLLLDENGVPVKQDYLIDEANLFGSNTCVRVFEGANSISIWEVPKELQNFPRDQTYGWIMYPDSNNCNAGKDENDPTRQKAYISLEQGIYGWRQSTGFYSGGFPYPVSFRLWINPEIFNPSGIMAGTYPPFSSFGANKNIPSGPEVMDYDFARGEASDIDPNDPIAREYDSRNMRIYQPDDVVDNIIAPLTRLRRGPGVTAETLTNFRTYPKQYYNVYDPRPPAEVFRPIIVLNRLATDLTTGAIRNADIDPVQLGAFFEAFIGPPISHEHPLTYDWPNAQLRTYLRNLPGFSTPVDPDTGAIGYISPNGHTAQEVLNIAQVFGYLVNEWIDQQPDDVMADWGYETDAQANAEKWLYSMEENAVNLGIQAHQQPVSLQDEAFEQQEEVADLIPPPDFVYGENGDDEIIEGAQDGFDENSLEAEIAPLAELSGLVREGQELVHNGDVSQQDISRHILMDDLSHVGVSQLLDQSGEEAQENTGSQVIDRPSTGNILNQPSDNDVSFQSAAENPFFQTVDPRLWSTMTLNRLNKLRQKYPINRGLSRQSSISSIGGMKTGRDPGPD